MPPTSAANTSVARRGQLARRQRPRARARHQRVDLLLDQAVDGGRRARNERDAEGAEDERHDAAASPGVARNMPITA